MVDNENQWEDVDYSDGADSSDEYLDENYDEDYSDEDYESYGDGNSAAQPQKVNLAGCLIVLILLAGIIAGVVFFVMPKLKGDTGTTPAPSAVQGTEQMSFGPDEGMSQEVGESGEMFFNEAGGDATEMMSVDFNQNTQQAPQASQPPVSVGAPETPVEQPLTQQEGSGNDDLFAQGDDFFAGQTQEESEIMVSYNKSSRENPFKPPFADVQANESSELLNNTPFEIIEPPVSSVPDENLTRLLQTQISGILYDEESPSAIVNLNGMDQFVKPGDTVAGYTIDYITKDKVQISYQNNSYVASVGELFTRGVLEKQPAVVNLENKFAGRYKNNQ